MTYKHKEIVKLYHSIGDVALEIGRPTSAIRFWEDTFGWYLKLNRDTHGNRSYSTKQLNRVKLISDLTREGGMTLEGANAAIKEKWARSYLIFIRNWRETKREFKDGRIRKKV